LMSCTRFLNRAASSCASLYSLMFSRGCIKLSLRSSAWIWAWYSGTRFGNVSARYSRRSKICSLMDFCDLARALGLIFPPPLDRVVVVLDDTDWPLLVDPLNVVEKAPDELALIILPLLHDVPAARRTLNLNDMFLSVCLSQTRECAHVRRNTQKKATKVSNVTLTSATLYIFLCAQEIMCDASHERVKKIVGSYSRISKKKSAYNNLSLNEQTRFRQESAFRGGKQGQGCERWRWNDGH